MAVSDELLAEETNERSVLENVQLGHRDFETLHLQIAGDGNGLTTTSRISPKERRKILECKHRWIHLLFVILRLGGGGADGWLREAGLLLLTKMIAGEDVCGGTFPTGVTLVDLLIISFAMTGPRTYRYDRDNSPLGKPYITLSIIDQIQL